MMSARKKSSWQSRRPPSHGPRLLDGDAPEAGRSPGGIASNFSWRLALGIIAIGVLAAAIAHYAC